MAETMTVSTSGNNEKFVATSAVDVESKADGHVSFGQADAALEYLRAGEVATFSDVDEKKLLRKIDWMVVPLMWAIYFLQYLDKILINYASVMGLLDDTGMRTDQFSNLALAFYVSYLFFELPTGYFMQRLPTAKYLGLNVTLWGLLTTLNCVAKNFPGLVVLRVLLGCFESAVAPALILITSMWYKRNEQPKRIGFWYLGTGTATIVGALVAYGLLFYGGDKFYSWQIMFLIFGLITIAVGITVIVVFPDNPMKSRLSHEEKLMVIERLRENRTGIENKNLKWGQFFEAFKDPQTYLIAIIIASGNISNAAISSFSSLIIKNFGFDTKETELLTIPGGVVSVISILLGTYLAGRFDQRCFCIIGILCSGLLGGCLMAFAPSDNKGAKLAGNYLTNCVGAALPLLYSTVGANVAGHTKKVTMNAIALMSFCLGNILGPLSFRTEDEPEYMPAKVAIVATVSVAIAFTVALKCYYIWENRRRDRKCAGLQHEENSEFLDLTDKENLEFRYKH
ncbi:Sphingolipid long chain base-responsive protein PIL1 domain protein [Aspergillus niger]|uniref:Sphingolipid long chain base-responsive protein PIL1 domain protein n=1 Tax=Aspergillus niger TaxID=5061 RepID=A0A505I5J4_ASPNG|nr:Sphingolipid long chain base-responsive protein PIL1 domain protein [Aspergillus niger]